MLTDSSYNLTTNAPPSMQEEKNTLNLRDYQIFMVMKVLGYSKKVVFLKYFNRCISEMLVLFILVQQLHSIITYVGCLFLLFGFKSILRNSMTMLCHISWRIYCKFFEKIITFALYSWNWNIMYVLFILSSSEE